MRNVSEGGTESSFESHHSVELFPSRDDVHTSKQGNGNHAHTLSTGQDSLYALPLYYLCTTFLLISFYLVRIILFSNLFLRFATHRFELFRSALAGNYGHKSGIFRSSSPTLLLVTNEHRWCIWTGLTYVNLG